MRVLVTGATGMQGGAVARALRAKNHSVRGLTRSTDSEAARALTNLGVELVTGDLGSAEDVHRAVAGCDAVFGLTNYWEHFAEEVTHGKNVVDASRRQGARLVLSTLPSAAEASGGEISVPHLETKRAIEVYAASSGAFVNFVHVAFYFENFLSWFAPRPGPDGVLSFGFPQGDTPLAAVAVEDVGPTVASIMEDEFREPGRTFGVVGDELPCALYADAMSRSLGATVRYQHVPASVFASFGFPGAADLASMFEFTRRFVPTRREHLEDTRRRHPGVMSFDDWLDKNAGALRRVVG